VTWRCLLQRLGFDVDVKLEVQTTYHLELDDKDIVQLWKVFDMARDTMQRLPKEVHVSELEGFMTYVESATKRHRLVG